MQATKTSSPILSSDLYSRLVNSAMQSLERYIRQYGGHYEIPIYAAGEFVVTDLNREYHRELQKIPKSESEKKRGRFGTTLGDIAEAAAMRLGFERRTSRIHSNTRAWVR